MLLLLPMMMMTTTMMMMLTIAVGAALALLKVLRTFLSLSVNMVSTEKT